LPTGGLNDSATTEPGSRDLPLTSVPCEVSPPFRSHDGPSPMSWRPTHQ
jgi:hypothetical protein